MQKEAGQLGHTSRKPTLLLMTEIEVSINPAKASEMDTQLDIISWSE